MKVPVGIGGIKAVRTPTQFGPVTVYNAYLSDLLIRFTGAIRISKHVVEAMVLAAQVSPHRGTALSTGPHEPRVKARGRLSALPFHGDTTSRPFAGYPITILL